jgi:acyl-CoA hydrolase
MERSRKTHWKKKLVTPEDVLLSIKPGMTIFLGSGVAEPRTLMKYLIDSGVSNTNDLDVIQLTSHSDMLSLKKRNCQKLCLKTFVSTLVDAIQL